MFNYDLDYKAINNIKTLALDMINEAKSGHPGIVLGAANIIYTLYSRHLNFNPNDPSWINRDRFVMSGGHGSALLYSTLFTFGYNYKIDDLKKFRKLNSKTPGHPELDVSLGIETTTGPLGQGIANAVGMAIAEKHLNSRFNNMIDHYTYVLCGDGDLMEGISYEACSIAGNLGLNKLIILYDSNNITLDFDTSNSFKENVIDRFKAMNFNTIKVEKDGIDEIDKAISLAKKEKEKPTLIEIKTIIGKDSSLENTNKVHGNPLSEEDINKIKEKYGFNTNKFNVYDDVTSYTKYLIEKRILNVYNEWNNTYKNIPNIDQLTNKSLLIPFENITVSNNDVAAPRDISHKILNNFVKEEMLILGGSADLSSSCKTNLDNFKVLTKENPTGKNILFGVREHAMAAILNGITLSGIRCFASTFLAFSDYLKPALRMSAMMNLPVIYIFTHDSIMLGEDGKTHQPVEQLISLRSVPNLNVYRPCDAKEILGCYKEIISKNNNPSALILSKTKNAVLEETNENLVEKGAYVLIEPKTNIKGTIFATGDEVHLAVKIAKQLNKKNIGIRVVSVVCMEKFMNTNKEYKDSIMNNSGIKFAIEYGSSASWYQFDINLKNIFSIDTFGESGNAADIVKYFGLDYETILKKIEKAITEK